MLGERLAYLIFGVFAACVFIFGCLVGAAVILALRQSRLTLKVGAGAVFFSGLAMLSAVELVMFTPANRLAQSSNSGSRIVFAFLAGLLASVGAAVLTHLLSEPRGT